MEKPPKEEKLDQTFGLMGSASFQVVPTIIVWGGNLQKAREDIKSAQNKSFSASTTLLFFVWILLGFLRKNYNGSRLKNPNPPSMGALTEFPSTESTNPCRAEPPPFTTWCTKATPERSCKRFNVYFKKNNLGPTNASLQPIRMPCRWAHHKSYLTDCLLFVLCFTGTTCFSL